MTKKRRFSFRGMDSLIASVVSTLAGLLFGFILLLIFNPAKAGNGFLNILLTGVRSTPRLAKVLYTAAPLNFLNASRVVRIHPTASTAVRRAHPSAVPSTKG